MLSAYDSIAADSDTKIFLDNALDIYNQNINCDSDDILKLCLKIERKLDIHEYTVELLVFICMSKKLLAVYEEKGISKEIFHNSMLDLKYKLEE